jgi:hypothetical protein
MDEELKNRARFVFFRVSLAKANTWIDEISVVLEKRAKFLRAAPSGRMQMKRTLERYEVEKLEGNSRQFVTREDVKEMPTLRNNQNNQKNALITLQSLERFYTSTDSHLRQLFVKWSQPLDSPVVLKAEADAASVAHSIKWNGFM